MESLQKLTILLYLIIVISTAESTAKSAVRLPLVINTWAFSNATNQAWKVLTNGGTALDALVEGCATCEREQCDGTVGYGGSPDEHGETTLDALIMDGSNMNTGAVGGMRKIKDAIKVARHVLHNTRHTLLVGDLATQFAREFGFKEEHLSTQKSKEIWRNWFTRNYCQPNFWVNVVPDPTKYCGPYFEPEEDYVQETDLNKRKDFQFGPGNHDTIGMIVIDENEQIFAGTSTNGATHKIPGRVGDSPIPGAGAYADNEVGAAAATGDGDIMMRFLPSFLAVEYLRSGMDPRAAAKGAMVRIIKHYPDFVGGLIVTDNHGNYSAACYGMDKFPFTVAYGNQKEAVVEYVEC